nr:MAG TPA: hypothetical protein [Caudoviricetes sp.]
MPLILHPRFRPFSRHSSGSSYIYSTPHLTRQSTRNCYNGAYIQTYQRCV